MSTLSVAELSHQLPAVFPKPAVNCFIINGDRICDKESFLREFSEVLGFPDYFGFNWDAFSDCVTDLSWLDSSNGFLIIYKNSHAFRNASPDEWAIANEILLDAVDYWHEQGNFMTILFV
ncbi:barstar family protein [Methylomagnum sp.]